MLSNRSPMTFSRFNYIIEDYPIERFRMVYNTFRKTFLVLSPQNLDLTQDETSCTALAVKLGILVEDPETEWEGFCNWWDTRLANHRTLDLTLLLTYDCNARCAYCYEKGIHGSETLSSGQIQQLVDWIAAYLEANDLTSVDLCYHGGEPMLLFETMRTISSRLKAEYGERVQLSIVTNGTLLHQRTEAELESLAIDNWQITLDGVGENHNRCRPVAGLDAYSVILEGMKKLRNAKQITVNINVGMLNRDTILDDMDHLIHETASMGNVRFALSLIRDLAEGSAWELPKIEAATILASLYEKLWNSGHDYALREALPNALCTLLVPHAYVLSPKGDIRQCISAVEHRDFLVGTLAEPPLRPSETSMNETASMYWKTNKPCRNCVFLPLCMGRCAFERMRVNPQASCRKAFYEAICGKLAKWKFEQQMLEIATS